LVFFSCSKKITRKTPESNVPKSELAQFVSMDDIANINIGMSFTNVKTILGIPFNIIMGQNGGFVLLYYSSINIKNANLNFLPPREMKLV